MSAQPDSNAIRLPTLLASDDSDDETSQEEDPITSWNDLSIIERVGLNSLEMSENDVETAFSQITLAFRCDQYTLKQRLQAEEHARNLAEENVQLELARGRETLEMLKALCLDSRRSTILQKLELSLDILGGTVERISNTAEVLGAVHQEARVSRAVELMVAHVENLRRRYERNLCELEEARRQIQLRTSQRNPYNRDSDQEENGNNRLTKQGTLRRRVSLTVITNPVHEKRKRERKRGGKKSSSLCPSPCPSSESSVCVLNDSCSTDDRVLVPSEMPGNLEQSENINESPVTPAVVSAEEPHSEPHPEEPQAKPESADNTSNKNSSFETVRQRHRSRAALSRKRSERKSPHLFHKSPARRCGPLYKAPGTRWMHRCCWVLLYLCPLVFVSFIITIYFSLIPYEESY